MTQIKCRLANIADVDLLFSWVNDAKVRKNSFLTENISYQEHIDWFRKVLSDNSNEIYIYYLDNEPMGQVRLNYSNTNVLISYSIAQKYRGQGFGKLVIHDIEQIIIKTHSEVDSIQAKVKVDNIASQKIFEDNNYNQILSDSNFTLYAKTIDSKSEYTNKSKCLNSLGERVLLLTNNRNALKLYAILLQMGENVLLYSGALSDEQILYMNPQIIISYNYKYMINNTIISMMNGRVVNLHISYLPWNKGSDPNFWSFIENTPKGVTIHKIDEHLDTGSILFQKKIDFNEDIETFRTSYEKLNTEIVSLFCDNWNTIKSDSSNIMKQCGIGTYHRKSDFERYVTKYPVNYDETITEYKTKLCIL